MKNFGQKEAWPYPGTAQFFLSTPYFISGMGKATNFKSGRYIQRVHANKNPLKIWEKMERGRIQGLPKFFQYPLLYQEWVKLRTSNFVSTFLILIGTKARYKFRGKVAGCVVRTLDSFQSTHALCYYFIRKPCYPG